ncbi:hypothetical protein CMUST_09820 [Corynebacterium mustelae]|uniref:DUF7824 domain-containing protein n=1 Tax=Corynebacterium mustelae TaxID=571915 RepID=A0A0G3H0J8_9CORY|nr:DUF6493 family protein [Corynebacterium mustelae]AKK06280.1 hypothetical protein CMUST_09820 [Corynebacterium mustelae]
MKLNPHLQEAVAIFKELGWDKAEIGEAPTLPLGTPEQQKIALKGLRTGDWGKSGQIDENSWGWTPAVDVNTIMLGYFTTRLGVSVKRAVQVLTMYDDRTTAAVIQACGQDFAEEFIAEVFSKNSLANERMRGPALEVVLTMGLEYPAHENFYNEWASILLASFENGYRALPLELFQPTFTEIFHKAQDSTFPAFGKIARETLKVGWIDRETAITTTITSIGKASSPGTRKEETEVLFHDLNARPEEILPFFDLITGVVATAEAPMVEQFALRLIPLVEDTQLADIALPALYAKTKKATLAVVKALRARPKITADTREVLAPRIEELSTSRDATTAKLASNILTEWGATVTQPTAAPTSRWEDTPKLWELPRFERGAASVDTLSQVAHKLTAEKRENHHDVSDVDMERFFALANELARTDIEAAQRALKGTKGIAYGAFAKWAENPTMKRCYLPLSTNEIFPARLRQFIPKLGKIPCLLSEPSFVDLSITADDLVERLKAYEDAGAAALEADLQLALARLNPETITPDTSAQLDALDVPLALENGTLFARSATRIAKDYLSDPVKEPTRKRLAGKVVMKPHPLPESLAGLPKRLRLNNSDYTHYFCVFPHFGDSGFRSLAWSKFIDPELRPAILQAARHGKPLPPAAVINFFGLQRPIENAGGEFATALADAWQRGLIRPGVADVAFLDWRDKLMFIKAFATALDDAAHSGMLSVVWPILDDLIGACMQGPSLVAGTAEVALVMETHAPAVAAAIAEGRAPEDAGLVPNLRQLVASKGKNKAIAAAKNAVALLPSTQGGEVSAPEPAEVPVLSDAEFEKRWKHAGTNPAAPVGDDVEISFAWRDAGTKPKRMTATIRIPALGQTVRVDKDHGWFYDVVHEQQCEVFIEDGSEKYLRWDRRENQLILGPDREGRVAGPVPSFLLAILLAYTCDGKHHQSARYDLKEFVTAMRLSPDVVAESMRDVLSFADFSPVPTVNLMEKKPQMVQFLWPALTESLKHAAQLIEQEVYPRWLNKVLDVVKIHAPVLIAATDRGHIPATEWACLQQLRSMKKKCAAKTKAEELARIFPATAPTH